MKKILILWLLFSCITYCQTIENKTFKTKCVVARYNGNIVGISYDNMRYSHESADFIIDKSVFSDEDLQILKDMYGWSDTYLFDTEFLPRVKTHIYKHFVVSKEKYRLSKDNSLTFKVEMIEINTIKL